MLRKMGNMAREELGLEDWLPPLVPYTLKDEVVMRVACVWGLGEHEPLILDFSSDCITQELEGFMENTGK